MKLHRILIALSLFGILYGCGSSSEDEIRQWMVEERNQTRPKVAPIPAPKQFKPEAYTNATAMEPFSNQKLTQALKRDSAQVAANGALVAPELLRRPEHLESFPLDEMKMVGFVNMSGKAVALISVQEKLYHVKQGAYLGQHYGLVKKINETNVTLREIVQDAVGEWIERVATLQLQESSK